MKPRSMAIFKDKTMDTGEKHWVVIYEDGKYMIVTKEYALINNSALASQQVYYWSDAMRKCGELETVNKGQ